MPNPLLDHIEEKTFSVGEYLELVNELLGPLRVSVEGEITDLKILPIWVFFSLKDSESGEVLRCGLHAGVYRRLGVNVEEGMMVKIHGYGKISTKTGNFGFWVSKIEPLGEGALRKAYEILVNKLEKEGLFARKRELPEFISHIGVISSRNGVVLQDLLENLEPLGITIDFVHSGVEGADSAVEIDKAIKHFSQTKEKPQVLVLIRGGGSMESLQGFNNENVVRSIFGAPMPVLVGIGHDVDAPIATMVADWSASTPTAVAHVINESWAPLTKVLPDLARTLTERFRRRLRDIEHFTESTFLSMKHAVAQVIHHFEKYIQIIERAKHQMVSSFTQVAETAERYNDSFVLRLHTRLREVQARVQEHERLLAVSDPKRVLKRGYGLVYNVKGRLVRRLEDINEGDTVKTRLSDGVFESKVTEKEF